MVRCATAGSCASQGRVMRVATRSVSISPARRSSPSAFRSRANAPSWALTSFAVAASIPVTRTSASPSPVPCTRTPASRLRNSRRRSAASGSAAISAASTRSRNVVGRTPGRAHATPRAATASTIASSTGPPQDCAWYRSARTIAFARVSSIR